MISKICSCCRTAAGASYESGPTACMASPEVQTSIKQAIAEGHVLSLADSRLATMSGMLSIPSIGKTGFNDGLIYPPEEAAGPELAAAAAAGVRPSARVALKKPTGKQTLNCLVLLVDFPDNVGTTPPAHFQNLLFDPTNNNSMHSFYLELSYGRLNVTGQVTGWIRANNPYSYYTNGQSGTGGAFPRNTPGLLDEALRKYCATNSLAQFDVNGDGFVDGLFLVHAGGGAEAEPDPNRRNDMIWSHKWTLPTPLVNNGVRAYAYFTAPEDGRLGVFSHEFGHFLGLPDLYDTSYRSRGVGNWCLMAGGSWNGSGDRPARLSAWCLAALGWIKPKNVTASGALSLKPIETDHTACYRLWTRGKASKEYFLLEYRPKSGRDSDLPGGGLALWHIDDRQSDNSNPLAYRVALVQADGRRDLELNRNEGDRGDVFPGSRRVKKVNDTGSGHPHTRKNDGTATGVSLSRIKIANKTVTVHVTV